MGDFAFGFWAWLGKQAADLALGILGLAFIMLIFVGIPMFRQWRAERRARK